jgi:hypothetical protein
MVNTERASCVAAYFLTGLFAGEIELVVPSSGVPGDYRFQRVVPSGSRDERYAKAVRW